MAKILRFKGVDRIHWGRTCYQRSLPLVTIVTGLEKTSYCLTLSRTIRCFWRFQSRSFSVSRLS